MGNPFDDLRAALLVHDGWPAEESGREVVAAARRMVRAVDGAAAAKEVSRTSERPRRG